MSAEQIPTKAAPAARKAPPQVPTVPTAGQPGTAEQRAAAQDTGATSPTSSVAPTEIVLEAASTLLFGMDNFNNGDPQFDPRASTTSAAEGTGRRGRSRRGRRAAGHVPGPTAAGADDGCAARFSAASGGGAGAVDLDTSKPEGRGGGGRASDQEQLPAGPHADGAGPGTRPMGHVGEQSGRHGRRSVGTDRDSSVRPAAGADDGL
eukprot:s4474_g4.t1